MSLRSVFTMAEAYNRAVVERDTWGHLDTNPDGAPHPGFVLFAKGCHGDIVVLEWELEGVTPNPWLYRALNEFVGDAVIKSDRSWGVWVFEGHYRVLKGGSHKFIGKVRPCRVTTRFGKKRSF